MLYIRGDIMKFRMSACLIAACCLLAGCEKKDVDSQQNPASAPDTEQSSAETTTTATKYAEEAKPSVEMPEGIPETAVVKVTQTTYRDGEVWETVFIYRNEHDDSVAFAYLKSDGSEVISSCTEYEYDENGKRVYEKNISDSGSFFEYEYLTDNTAKFTHYDEKGRVEGKGESTYDAYGNEIFSHNIVYNEDGEVVLELTVDNSDCDYDENGRILVCRRRSEYIVCTITNTYDENGNLLCSEQVSADNESITRNYEYDADNNLIFKEEVRKSDADTVYFTETYEYQYDGTGRKIRQDYRYIHTEYDKDLTEYTLYEYTDLERK